MNKAYTVRLQFTHQQLSEVVSAISAREALTNALDRVRGRYPTIGDPSAVSVSVQWRELERAAEASEPAWADQPRKMLEKKATEQAILDAAPPPVRPCAATNGAVRVLVERRFMLEQDVKTSEDQQFNINCRLMTQRSDLEAVRSALEAIGADPDEAYQEEF